MKIALLFKRNYTSGQLIGLSAMFIATALNIPFLAATFYALSPSTLHDWAFLVSVPALLTFLTIIFITITGGFIFPKIVISLTILLSSTLLYANTQYGIIFDDVMIQNIVETNSSEAFSYLNISLALKLVAFGLLPIAFIIKQQASHSLFNNFKSLLKINLLAVAGILVIVFLFYKDYSGVGRNHHELPKQIIPYAFYDSGIKLLKSSYLYPPRPYRVLDEQPTHQNDTADRPNLIVVVLGETARADNFSLNGYPRATNSHLTSNNVVSFSNVTSCGTATAVSVPCMFSRLNREGYSHRIAQSQDNVLDIVERSGIDVTWIDNNSSCKGVCARVDNIRFDPSRDKKLCDGEFCYDEILIAQLQQALEQKSNTDRFIVLHMIGSHGPTYFRRYPEAFKKFTPDCAQSDIQNCTQEQLTNTYDNTIVYTDYVLSELIKTVKSYNQNAAVLYVSDHGESLGENGLYLHGFPYSLAPEEQIHVPMIYWDSRMTQPEFSSCVASQAKRPLSHDNLFDTLLGLAGVQSIAYKKELDVLGACSTS